MNEPVNVLHYVIGSFIFMYLSGCSSDYAHRDIRVSDISCPINKFSWELQDIHNDNGFRGGNRALDAPNKYAFVSNNYHRSYNDSNKGSYSSCCYTVKPGDTLFYIAWITGNDCRVLANRNNINIYDVLKVGQILQVGHENQYLNNVFFKKSVSENDKMRDFHRNCDVSSCCLRILKPDHFKNNVVGSGFVKNKSGGYVLKNNFVNLLSLSDYNISSNNQKNLVGNEKKVNDISGLINKKSSSIGWTWPTYGKVINSFSAFEGGKKGIDISGTIGQPIFSAAAGKVVYAGNALVGYGNLIIIKHKNDFLSTYAHNDKVLVTEQQYVQGGQKIATMGNSESDKIKLYFEIRYRGKSVNPLYYLPKR